MVFTRLALLAICCTACRAANFENMKLFERLGLGRTVDADSPRIRSLHTPGNSPMFVIRLPPSSYYYLNSVRDAARATPAPNFPRVSLDFTINGKPNRLYHYNLGMTPPMVDQSTAATAASTAAPTATTPSPKMAAAERLRQKYTSYFRNKPSSTMKKYRYAYNGKPSSFYVMRGSSDRKPLYFRRFA